MRIALLSVVLPLMLLGGGCTPFLIDGPYEGYVVDADSGEPIEGAVVAMSWYTWAPTVAGEVHSCYDSDETATDEKGYFRLPGKGLRVLSNLDEPNFLILKSGYWPEELYLSDGQRMFRDSESVKIHGFNSNYKGDPYSSGLLCTKGSMKLYKNEHNLVVSEIIKKIRSIK